MHPRNNVHSVPLKTFLIALIAGESLLAIAPMAPAMLPGEGLAEHDLFYGGES